MNDHYQEGTAEDMADFEAVAAEHGAIALLRATVIDGEEAWEPMALHVVPEGGGAFLYLEDMNSGVTQVLVAKGEQLRALLEGASENL